MIQSIALLIPSITNLITRSILSNLRHMNYLGQLGLLVKVAAAEAEPSPLMQELVAGKSFTKGIVQA
jgi:hypothetical protein